jgi:DNA-binding GntR family transcriptional regulator
VQDQIYDKLRRAIMSGKLVPGQAVSIRSLAFSLGTSAIPVREALRRLAAERAIEVLPNGSVGVSAMSRARFEDLRRTRVLIEGFTVEQAAGRLSDADFRKMESADEKRKVAVRERDLPRRIETGSAPNNYLAKASDAPPGYRGCPSPAVI